MISVKYLFAVLVLICSVIHVINSEIANRSKNDDTECAKEMNITLTDIFEYLNDKTHTSEKMKCFFKCSNHKNGNMDEFGFINTKLFNMRIDEMDFLSRKKKRELKYCFGNTGPINTCLDVEKISICLSKIKEKGKCEIEHNITEADWHDMKKNASNVNFKFSCFAECFLKEYGIVHIDGKINMDRLYHEIDNWIKISVKAKDRVIECMKTLAPITTCSDVKPFMHCIIKRAAQKIKYCKEKSHVNVENPWHEFKKDVLNAPENILCFIKCSYEEDGVLDSDGRLEMTKLNKKIDEWVKLSAAEKAEADTCLKSVAPVKTCTDMKPINACIYKNKV